MEMIRAFGQSMIRLVQAVYDFLWGDLVIIPLPGGGSGGCHTFCESRTFAGIRCVCGYHCDLQLFGDDHAAGARKAD